MSDLVSGVLTRLAELERIAQAAKGEIEGALKRPIDEIDLVHPGEFESWMAHANENRPSAVLRLCRAHRQIVERFESIRFDWLKLHERIDEGLTIPEHEWREKPILDELYAQWHEAVRWLAVGLGVVEEEDRT